LTQARSKIGVVKLYEQARQERVKGFAAKFNRIRGELKGEIGGNINRTKDVLELKKRLQKEGLIPKSKKAEEGLGAIFARQIEAGKKAEPRAKSLPQDLRDQLFALGGAGGKNTLDRARERFSAAQKGKDPNERWEARKELAKAEGKAGIKPAPVVARQIEKSPGAETRTAPAVRRELAELVKTAKKGEMTLMMDDVSRIMRGSEPLNIQVAPGGGELGMNARMKGSGTGTGSATGNTRWARDDAGDFDKAFKIYKRIRGDADMVNWDETVKNGVKIGEGSFGTVLKLGNVAHKRGEVGAQEADIIKKVGEAGIGPRLLGAEISTKKREGYGTDLHNGRIAMTVVPGKPMGDVKPDTKIAGKNVADIYWKAMADLHRQGIAHNDAHIDNILIDKSGKGRWVDLGLAQASPKAALAEAMGIFDTLRGAEATRAQGAAGNGNWQTRGWDATGVNRAERAKARGTESWKEFMQRFPTAAKVWENRGDAQYKLLDMGLSRSDVSSIIDHGIRSPLETYTKGAWAKLTDKQAQEVLNILYDGV
jgi:tRNA A-37 threonylcarbamoyl transferase component Bud32